MLGIPTCTWWSIRDDFDICIRNFDRSSASDIIFKLYNFHVTYSPYSISAANYQYMFFSFLYNTQVAQKIIQWPLLIRFFRNFVAPLTDTVKTILKLYSGVRITYQAGNFLAWGVDLNFADFNKLNFAIKIVKYSSAFQNIAKIVDTLLLIRPKNCQKKLARSVTCELNRKYFVPIIKKCFSFF